MATFKTHKNCGEFWGAKYCQDGYEFLEEYEDEVFDVVKKMIEEDGWDTVPNEIEIKAEKCLDIDCERSETQYFYIDPMDYLTNEQYDELQKLINEIYNDVK